MSNRKFFGQRNGVGAKPQQSTLAFHKPKVTAKDESAGVNGTEESEGTEGSEDVKSDVMDGDGEADKPVEPDVANAEDEMLVDIKDKSTNGEARSGSTEDSSPPPGSSKPLPKRTHQKKSPNAQRKPNRQNQARHPQRRIMISQRLRV